MMIYNMVGIPWCSVTLIIIIIDDGSVYSFSDDDDKLVFNRQTIIIRYRSH